MPSVFRRCGCRRPDGRSFGPLPRDQRQLNAPRVSTSSAGHQHGTWAYSSREVDSVTHSGSRSDGWGSRPRRKHSLQCRCCPGNRRGSCGDETRSIFGGVAPRVDEPAGPRRSPCGDDRHLRPVHRQGHRPRTWADSPAGSASAPHRFVPSGAAEQRSRHHDCANRIHAVLSSCLTMAVRHDLVSMNAASTSRYLGRGRELRVWEPAQVRTFLVSRKATAWLRYSNSSSERVYASARSLACMGGRRSRWPPSRRGDSKRVQVDTVVVTNHARRIMARTVG